MDPSSVAARFLAFTAYLNDELNKHPSPEEAGRYARRQWKRFLPYVDADLGRFLTGPPPSSNKSASAHPVVAQNPRTQDGSLSWPATRNVPDCPSGIRFSPFTLTEQTKKPTRSATSRAIRAGCSDKALRCRTRAHGFFGTAGAHSSAPGR